MLKTGINGIKRDNLKRLAFFLLPSILGILLAVTLPDGFLSAHSSISRLIDTLGDVLPLITRLSSLSAHPDVVKTTLSFLWLLIPFQIMLGLNKGTLKFDKAVVHEGPIAYGLILAIFYLTMYWFWVQQEVTPHDISGRLKGDIVFRRMVESKIWLGIWGGLLVTFNSMLVVGTVSYVRQLTGRAL